MKLKRLVESGWRSILYSIAILLLTQGANTIQADNYMLGGALATFGFILLMIVNYFK